MSWGWANAQLLYTHPKAVALERPLDLGKCARAFQPLRHKPIHVLTLPLLFDMFFSALE